MTVTRACTLLACLAALTLVGCRSGGSAGSDVGAAVAGTESPAFEAMRRALQRGTPARERGDADALRALEPGLSSAGLALLRARMPHDLRRSDVGLFLEARAAFGDALKFWVGAVAGDTDPALVNAYDTVVEAFHAWVGAYRGLRPERAV